MEKRLTDSEKEWIKQHPVIRLGVDSPSYFRGAIDNEGNYVGVGADYMRLLEKRIGVSFKTESGLTRKQVSDKLKKRELDVVTMVSWSSEKEAYLNFTDSLAEMRNIIIVRKNNTRIRSIFDLAGKTVSINRDYEIHYWLAKNYREIILFPKTDAEQGLKAVATGEVDAYAGDMPSAVHTINKLHLTDLKIAADMPFTVKCGIGVRKDWPKFIPILNKAISTISREEHKAIKDKTAKLSVGIELKNVFLIFIPIVIAVILITLMTANLRLRKEIARRKTVEETLRKSEETFRVLMNAIPESASLVSPEGNYIAVNETVAKRMGQTVQKLIGTSIFDNLPYDLAKKRKDYFQESISSGRPVSFEDCRFGRVISNSIIQIPDSEGKVYCLAVLGIDITEQRMDEERLESLLKISSYKAENIQELLDYSLKEAISLAKSSIGYVFLYDEGKDEFTVRSCLGKTAKTPAVHSPGKIYSLEKNGIWSEPVRQRKPVFQNALHSSHSLGKGYPEGHPPLHRFLSVPVFVNEKIVAVVAVANKETDYEQDDANQLSHLMDTVWHYVERREAEAEKERLIAELKKALAEIKTLSDLLPICAYCKNIRDDKGYWNKLESYITKHAGTRFSHGICPDCMKKNFPEFMDEEKK
ncbi:MAG: transporter substrate-binding domain-containing protein [Victivallales bacterium]|jgi:PAS domain S-box-containing protein